MSKQDRETVSYSRDGEIRTVDLYSDSGRELLAELWLKLSMEYKRMYEPTWLGIPIIQLPEDILQLQELIWKLRPDRIIETGVAHGGSLVFSATMLELLGNDGRVLGIDIDIREPNSIRLDAHPLRNRFELFEGSSIEPPAIDKAMSFAAEGDCVLVILDSKHSYEHVLAELEFYHRLVTPDSYLVAMDGAQALACEIPRGDPAWKDDNPLAAIHEFLARHSEFTIDRKYTRMDITASPDGYLRRRK